MFGFFSRSKPKQTFDDSVGPLSQIIADHVQSQFDRAGKSVNPASASEPAIPAIDTVSRTDSCRHLAFGLSPKNARSLKPQKQERNNASQAISRSRAETRSGNDIGGSCVGPCDKAAGKGNYFLL
jgi:hypothetical protein